MDYGWGRALGATPPPTSQKANPDARRLTMLPVALALTVPERWGCQINLFAALSY